MPGFEIIDSKEFSRLKKFFKLKKFFLDMGLKI